ncbi:hypothetical protein [Leucobacter sp. G161]|uniref:hypothetical protein n=1 Tax=Leucobacter sp. G161 TaxID=663704 RepID=UPI00073BAB58|nr:hypothetical protein [Leucobacter sp. G161]KUF08438.1 hypothetical protein AUL38_04600 [Leucobacter sp. G161]
MSDTAAKLDSLERAGYSMELLGESLVVEGREIRQAVDVLRDQAQFAIEHNEPFIKDAAIEAAASKLNGDVAASIRFQFGIIRDTIPLLIRT